MGLIDFVKSAGAKLLGRDDEKAVEEQLTAAAPADEAMEAMRENLRLRKMEARLKQAVDGLGLDSIDVLELAMAIHKRYGIKTRADDAQNREIFASIRNLAAYVAEHRPSSSDADA